ncbi:MAG: 1-acyl-sn-glycerol-3-phosphate acyltransferase [Woeseiaceae bacterium]|nr:1-acyl-sn-glycerol-3-phosphate acyltransferase [Woeseiaceae bacterium]
MVAQSANTVSRVASLDERDVLKSADFQAALRGLAKNQQRPFDEMEDYAKECLDELAVRPRDRYLGWAALLARFMYTRSFDAEFDVNKDAIERLKELGTRQPLVFLWSHKSHLDSFVFMRALYDADFRPQPLSFAGINMNFAGLGALAKHSGAIFLRRSFSDDEVYKLVFKYFIDYLVGKRVPLSWSIEGTRSRTGVLMPPKLGLLHWVVESYRRAACEDALFVPVAISFDQIPEIDDYVAMQRGMPKRKESLRWFIDYITGMKSKFGRIYVRFAEPVSLSETAEVPAALLGDDENRAQVRRLAFEICSRIENVKPITTTDLVTLVLLAAGGRGLDERQIRAHAEEICELIARRGLPTVGDLEGGKGLDLRRALDSLTETELLQPFDKATVPVYVIAPGQQLAAAYYRNTIVHYFLSSAIAEVALASAEGDSPERTVRDSIIALRDLLKFEFFFKRKTEFRDEAVQYLDFRYPDWRTGKGVLDTHRAPLFGHGLLRSFIEAYWVLAQVLVSYGERGIVADEREALVSECLNRGEELLLRKEIRTEAALSQPLFSNAIRLARHRSLVSDADEDLKVRRDAFAAEVDSALAGIERLQRVYDRET